MRELKFRGKRANNGQWIYGSVFYGKTKCYINQDSMLPIINSHANGGWIEVDKETVTQYIGLKDKNGKEIYEGDIVKAVYGDSLVEFSYIGFIKFSHNSLQYGIQTKSGLFKPFSEYHYKKIEVIGNVFENPELLEGE